MSATETVRESEECQLARCGSCDGTYVAVASVSADIKLPCRCICHPRGGR